MTPTGDILLTVLQYAGPVAIPLLFLGLAAGLRSSWRAFLRWEYRNAQARGFRDGRWHWRPEL